MVGEDITLRESQQWRLGFWFLAMACILRSQDVWASVSNFVDFCIKLHASTDGARCVHGKNSKHVPSIQEAFASGPHRSSQLWSWPHSEVLVIILTYIPTLLSVQNDMQKMCIYPLVYSCCLSKCDTAQFTHLAAARDSNSQDDNEYHCCR